MLFAGVLIGTFLIQGFLAGRVKSPVFDETGDIAAGLSYIQTGEVRANLQHPPLLKELAGASLYAAGMRLPDSPQIARMLAGGGERAVGSALIASNGPDRVMQWSRAPFLLLAGGLGALLYWWGRRVVGETAALAALFLYTMDPTILGHCYLATMDVGLAAFTLLFLFGLWNYLQAPGWRRLAASGLALGLLLSTKFSAVFLLPVVALLLVAAARRPLTKVAAESTLLRGYGGAAGALGIMGLIAIFAIQALYLSPGGLFLYIAGLQRVNADHNPGYLVFLGGRLQHNFTTYFAAAYLLKEPIAAMVLAAIGLWALRKSALSGLAKLFLLTPPAAIFAAHTAFADNLGIRYIIPALPFLYLIGGMGAAWLMGKGRGGRIAAGALGCWLLSAAYGVAPDHLSYFNEAACLGPNAGSIGIDGGTRCGPLWLDDSNVDWGQGLKQVKEWTDRNAQGRPIKLAYFGSFPPAAYGLNAEAIAIDDLMKAPTPGIYVVSAHYVARVPAMGAGGEWLRRTAPAAIVGHAMYVYDVGAKKTQSVSRP